LTVFEGFFNQGSANTKSGTLKMLKLELFEILCFHQMIRDVQELQKKDEKH